MKINVYDVCRMLTLQYTRHARHTKIKAVSVFNYLLLIFLSLYSQLIEAS